MCLQRIKIRLKVPFRITRTSKASFLIKHITVIQGTSIIFLSNIFFASLQGRLIDSPVIIRKLQGRRNCRTALFKRDIPKFLVVIQMVIIINIRCFYHRLQGCLFFRYNLLGYGISQYRYGMIPTHAPVFISHQTPHRQHFMYTLLLMCNHGLYHICILQRSYQVQERMFRTIGIP